MKPLTLLFVAVSFQYLAYAQQAAPETIPSSVPASEPAPPISSVTTMSSAGSGLVSEPLSIEDSLTLRDPFKKPAKFADPGSDLSIPELERFALDQIKIVGIITGPKKAKALITTPSNKMFIVQENDKIGVYKGVIRKIKEKSIVVREKIVNLVGVEESTDNEIFLKSAETDKNGQQPSGQPATTGHPPSRTRHM